VANSKQAQFLAQGCSNTGVDGSQKLMPACKPLVASPTQTTMKTICKISVAVCFTFLVSCSDKVKESDIFKNPDTDEYSKIINEIMLQDSIHVRSRRSDSTFIQEKLVNLFVGNMDIPASRGHVQVIPWDFGDWVQHLYRNKITDNQYRAIDSTYFAFQNDTSNVFLLDTNIVKSSFLADIKTIANIKQTPNHGYFEFSRPILNRSNDRAYVQTAFVCSGHCSEGIVYVLKKSGDNWLLLDSQSTFQN